ncbi:CsgG/HfaB family protein [Aquirhabdus parva]|uniref:Peptidoglycan-binding protein n=1 Tax=Aquirhabdus parva TaxID=2283318 RepID=A0A345P582_9GAMM|nr:CsgG/HfaB family protein [Aquirhabdus parva]AXI02441.1 peptidoglycan-binding protein [Aquirhabdus parva]
MNIKKISLFAVVTPLLLTACASGIQMGGKDPNMVATGSAGGSQATGANAQLEKCDSPLGTISLVENQTAGWYTILTGEYHLPPTATLLRLMIQQSNCFVVVERSAAGMNAMNRERALESSGEMRKGSKYGKGQMVSSDYGLSPEVVFNENNAGGLSGAIGGLLGGFAGQAIGAIGASTKSRQATTMLTMVDNRSGVQLAVAEGNASKTDWAGIGGLFGRNGGGSLGGYQNTAQGKLIAAAFMDSYNGIVRSTRNYKAQQVKGGLGKGGNLKVGD